MHTVISLLLQSRKFWWFFYAASRRHNDVILLPAIHRVSGNDFFSRIGLEDNAPAHLRRARATVEHTTASRNGKLSCVQPVPSKQPRSQSCGLRVSCSIVSITDKSIVWMNWNGGSSMSGAVLNSRFFTRLLISGEEDIEHVSMLKEDILSTACGLTMLILSISVTFNVTCLTVTSLIAKSCQQHWPIHFCSFYKTVH